MIHHFQSCRNDAGCNDRGHGIARLFHIIKAGHDDGGAGWLGCQLERDFGHYPKHALRPHQHRQQVRSRRVWRKRTDFNDVTIHGDHAHLEYVVHGQPIFQTVHAPRVFRHVATDGASNLARRVWGVIESIGTGGLGDGQVPHTGLHDGQGRLGIDGLDSVELGQAEQHTLRMRHGATRQARARAPGNDRDIEVFAKLENGLHLGLGFRQHDHHRHGAVKGQPITFVGLGILFAAQHTMRGKDRPHRIHHARGMRGHQGRKSRFGNSIHRVDTIPCRRGFRRRGFTPTIS